MTPDQEHNQNAIVMALLGLGALIFLIAGIAALVSS